EAASAAMSFSLASSTIKAALSFAAGETVAADLISAEAAALAKGVTGTMFLNRCKVALVLLLSAALMAGAAGAFAQRQADAPRQRPVSAAPKAPEPPAEKEAPKPAEEPKPAADDNDRMTYAGRVLGPDGKLIAGAKLYLTAFGQPAEGATAGSDGRF